MNQAKETKHATAHRKCATPAKQTNLVLMLRNSKKICSLLITIELMLFSDTFGSVDSIDVGGEGELSVIVNIKNSEN